MAGHTIHMTEAEAASDFAGLLVRVRAGMEVIIERNAHLWLSCVACTGPPYYLGMHCLVTGGFNSDD